MNIKEELIVLKTTDSVEIALWKLYTQEETTKNIFLTHGTFSNKKVCLGIAIYFVKKGYTCWIMEWRNHGESAKTKKPFNIETIALLDIKTTFNYLINTLKIKKISCITHSGGGIALTMFLIKNTTYIKKIKSITMFACQVFAAGYSKKNYIKIFMAKHMCFLLGFVPGKLLKLGVQNESYNTMKQWFNWNLNNNFIGKQNFDYQLKMDLLKIPILAICGVGDRFIAPQIACKFFIDSFKNSNNKFVACGLNDGFKEDYNHSRIFLSKNASKEVWKICLNWIEK